MRISNEPTWTLGAQKARPKIKGDVTVDVAVIGGGLAGLLSAYFLVKEGKKVAVLESGVVGSGATLYTTAFITQVVDTHLSDLIKMFGAKDAALIWESGGRAIDTIEAIVKKEHIDCEFMRCPAYIYAADEHERDELESEQRAAREIGFGTKLVKNNVLPFEHHGFLEVSDQAKFHPIKFLHGVAAAVESSGGKIFEHSEALSIKEGTNGIAVKTSGGRVMAKDVIVATYVPFNNPKPVKFKKGMYTSYVFEVRLPKRSFPEGLFWDLNNPYHYFRIDRQATSDRMILGGEDHRAGVPVSERKNFDALREYLTGLLGERPYTIVRKWKGALLEPVDGLPLIGAYKPHQFVATAFSGNGMTFSTVSASLFRDLIAGRKNPWARIFDPARPLTVYRVAKKGMDYAGEFFGGAVKNTLRG